MKMVLIPLAVLSAMLLINNGETAPAGEPEVKVYLFFDTKHDTGLKLIEPGRGVSYLETNEDVSDPSDDAYSETKLDYCEGQRPATSSHTAPTLPSTPNDSYARTEDYSSCE